jgi:hypothetical protein
MTFIFHQAICPRLFTQTPAAADVDKAQSENSGDWFENTY